MRPFIPWVNEDEATGNGWNAAGMHHVDAHQQPDGKWLACVDGTQ